MNSSAVLEVVDGRTVGVLRIRSVRCRRREVLAVLSSGVYRLQD